jgi:hypothetical protein
MSYQGQWEQYRRRRNLFWVVWATYLPGVATIGLALRWALGSDIPIYVVAVAWMAMFLVCGNRMAAWKCPRCDRSFFMRVWANNPLATKCSHCGLHKWANSA